MYWWKLPNSSHKAFKKNLDGLYEGHMDRELVFGLHLTSI